MSPIDRKNSITTFRRSFNNFIENLEKLISKQKLEGSSLKASLYPIFKALGILENNENLSPIGIYLGKRYKTISKIDYSILRMQIIYYIQERDYKPLSLDILKFVFIKEEADKNEISDFLEKKGYFLGSNSLQSVGYFIPYLENIGYLKKQDGIYFIPHTVKELVSKLINSYTYKMTFNEKLYKEYLYYYKDDKIFNKIAFLRYGAKY